MTNTLEKLPAGTAKPAPSDGVVKTNVNETDANKVAKEIGGREGLDPTRYGDWEKAGRCVDF